jgi:cytochrome c biogenesis protein CcmG/thiol:disulfide interchange protein DsbE
VLLSMGGTTPSGDEFGSPIISGPTLPRGGTEPDAAVGMAVPEVVGADFAGTEVRIGHDGRAKILVFLAHWCPHCQAEVPVIKDWLEAGNLPDNVDLIAIATSTSSTRVNFPPSAWLADEGFEAPTIVDDEAYAVGTAYGVNAFPFWVFVSPDGVVAGRTSGELTADVISEIATTLAAMAPAG